MTLIDELRAWSGPESDSAGLCARAADEIERLSAMIHTPHNDPFLRGVSIEAEYQVQRWGIEHDQIKNGWDWYWTIGLLSQKAVAAFEAGEVDKAQHHCISTAALMMNLHGIVSKTVEQGRGQ